MTNQYTHSEKDLHRTETLNVGDFNKNFAAFSFGFAMANNNSTKEDPKTEPIDKKENPGC